MRFAPRTSFFTHRFSNTTDLFQKSGASGQSRAQRSPHYARSRRSSRTSGQALHRARLYRLKYSIQITVKIIAGSSGFIRPGQSNPRPGRFFPVDRYKFALFGQEKCLNSCFSPFKRFNRIFGEKTNDLCLHFLKFYQKRSNFFIPMF